LINEMLDPKIIDAIQWNYGNEKANYHIKRLLVSPMNIWEFIWDKIVSPGNKSGVISMGKSVLKGMFGEEKSTLVNLFNQLVKSNPKILALPLETTLLDEISLKNIDLEPHLIAKKQINDLKLSITLDFYLISINTIGLYLLNNVDRNNSRFKTLCEENFNYNNFRKEFIRYSSQINLEDLDNFLNKDAITTMGSKIIFGENKWFITRICSMMKEVHDKIIAVSDINDNSHTFFIEYVVSKLNKDRMNEKDESMELINLINGKIKGKTDNNQEYQYIKKIFDIYTDKKIKINEKIKQISQIN